MGSTPTLQQPAAHAGLLRQLGEAARSVHDGPQGAGNQERVLTMVFSEFGRRLAENASEGDRSRCGRPGLPRRDRGNAWSPGTASSLTDLDQGDLKHHTDFRQVYATVLESWLTDGHALAA